jgi:hypothetical protein
VPRMVRTEIERSQAENFVLVTDTADGLMRRRCDPDISTLVARFDQSEGYKLFSLMRASLVVKCHSATA